MLIITDLGSPCPVAGTFACVSMSAHTPTGNLRAVSGTSFILHGKWFALSGWKSLQFRLQAVSDRREAELQTFWSQKNCKLMDEGCRLRHGFP